jgi:hypothetical protein
MNNALQVIYTFTLAYDKESQPTNDLNHARVQAYLAKISRLKQRVLT